MEYLFTAAAMLGIDAVYLTVFPAGKYYSNLVEKIQGSPAQVKYLPSAFVYIVLVFALYYFVILPKKTITDAFLLGFSIYAVYELTTYSLFKKWPLTITILDSLWGGVLFALTTWLTRIVFSHL